MDLYFPGNEPMVRQESAGQTLMDLQQWFTTNAAIEFDPRFPDGRRFTSVAELLSEVANTQGAAHYDAEVSDYACLFQAQGQNGGNQLAQFVGAVGNSVARYGESLLTALREAGEIPRETTRWPRLRAG